MIPVGELVGQFIAATSRCLNGELPVISGNGRRTRDFTYADDIVNANLELLETDAVDGEVMDIGSTDNITIKGLAEHIIFRCPVGTSRSR